MDLYNNIKAILHYNHTKLVINYFHRQVIIVHNYKDYYVKKIQNIYHLLQLNYFHNRGTIIQLYIVEI